MRLQSYLSQCGVASRRKSAELIKEGKVQVNGRTIFEPGERITSGKDKVSFCGRKLFLSQYAYYLFYKPHNVITTAEDTHGRRTVLDYFARERVRLFPVGRLDKDTTGLLIVTNDGDLANHLTHPRYECEKTYEVSLKKELKAPVLAKLKAGVRIESGMTSPCEISSLGQRRGLFVYQIKLREGKKRQIRYMMREVGAFVVFLHRSRLGPLTLKGLKPGTYRHLSESEVASLRGKLR